MENLLKDKVVVVTGAAMGIGKAAAKAICAEGGKVAICDMNEEKGKETVKDLANLGYNARFYKMNVSKENEVKEAFEKIHSEMGPIYGLVNNAGILGVNKKTHEISESEWDHVINTNMKGVFMCTKHAIPQMIANGGGSIVNLSSVYGIVGNTDTPPYHASKGAIRIMSKVDALSYARKNIRVNSIHPGFIETPMVLTDYAKSKEGEEDVIEGLSRLHPMGRLGKPEEIANGIVFLLSDKASFMTGSEMVIDGGYTAQ